MPTDTPPSTINPSCSHAQDKQSYQWLREFVKSFAKASGNLLAKLAWPHVLQFLQNHWHQIVDLAQHLFIYIFMM